MAAARLSAEDVDAEFSKYVQGYLDKFGVSDEEAVHSLDYYPASKYADEIVEGVKRDHAQAAKLFYSYHEIKELQRKVKECVTVEGPQHFANCRREREEMWKGSLWTLGLDGAYKGIKDWTKMYPHLRGKPENGV